MIHFLYGENKEERKKAVDELVSLLHAESVFSFDGDSWNIERAKELMASRGLFSEKIISVFNNILSLEDVKDFVSDSISELADSENIFIFLEDKPLKWAQTLFKKYAEKFQGFDADESLSADKRFNVFSLTDAFGRRDKKEAWIIFQKAVEEGAAPEEIQGMIFWQIKAMMLAKGKSQTDADIKKTGLNPFVFKKSHSFAKNFTDEELEKLSSRIVALYHDAHRGILDMIIGLEQLILESL